MLIKKRKDSLSGKCTLIKVQLFIVILKLFADRFCKRNFSLKLRIKLLFIPLKQIKLSFSKVTKFCILQCFIALSVIQCIFYIEQPSVFVCILWKSWIQIEQTPLPFMVIYYWGFLECRTYCNTGYSFLKSSPRIRDIDI